MRFRGITLFPYLKVCWACLCVCVFVSLWSGRSIELALFTKAIAANYIIPTAMWICCIFNLLPFVFCTRIFFLSKIIESDTQFLIWMQSMHVTLFMHHSHVSITAKKVLKCYCPPHHTGETNQQRRVQKKARHPNQQCSHWNTENYCGRIKRQNATLEWSTYNLHVK